MILADFNEVFFWTHIGLSGIQTGSCVYETKWATALDCVATSLRRVNITLSSNNAHDSTVSIIVHNITNLQILHISPSCRPFKCRLIWTGEFLISVSATDLGVLYDSHLSFRPHINKIVSKASQKAKLILKCFVSRDPTILSKAFCVFVRPILEFYSVIWNPGFKVDIDKIESVQKRFTRVCLPHLAYAERLAQT